MFKRVLAAAAVVVVAGCGTPVSEYAAYEGPVVQGSGGAKRSVGGVDVWSDGAPPRRYRIIGILSDNTNQVGSPVERAVAHAKRVGGDAVVLVDSKDRLAGMDKRGNTKYDTLVKYAVIKYVP